MAKKDEIRFNAEKNIARVQNLVDIYKDKLAGAGSGRRPTASADVLRAATVMLHASLEDFLRDLARWKLPNAAPESLVEIPLSGSERKVAKFTLANLARFRGKSVNEVISSSVLDHLAQETYNNVSDIKKLINAIGHDHHIVDEYAELLGNMMDRRHNIVHRADKNENTGIGHYRAKSLGSTQVNQWVVGVSRFVARVLDEV